MTVASSDSHVLEHISELASFFTGPWRNVAPYVRRMTDGSDGIVIPGMLRYLGISEIFPGVRRWDEIPDSVMRAEDREFALARQGVDFELLFPSVGLLATQHGDLSYVDAFSDAYNRWITECWTRPSFYRLALVGSGRPEIFRRTLTVATRNGFAGLLLPTVPPIGKWSDEIYRRMFAMAAEANLICAGHAFMSRSSIDPVRSAEMDAKMYLDSFVCDGILAKNGSLKVLYAEAGSSWVAQWLRERSKLGPSVVDRVRIVDNSPIDGPSIVIWGSDYPHRWTPERDGQVQNAISTLRLPVDRRHEFLSGDFWHISA